MTKRFAHIHTLVELRRDIAKYPESADAIIRVAIVNALPPKYNNLYQWIRGLLRSRRLQWVTTADIMKAFYWEANMASTALKELHGFGLLSREEYTDGHGKGYKYKIAEDNESV